MKKYGIALSLLILILICAFGFCGCGDKQPATDTDEGRISAAVAEGSFDYAQKETLTGFWETSAAYCCLGDKIYGKSVDLSGEDEKQRGAIILSVIMTGGNPYAYQGRDLVQELLDNGVEGAFAIPVLNFIALEAAGAEMEEATVAAYIDYCCEQLSTLKMGPDIGGWAAVALAPYAGDATYGEQVKAAFDSYLEVVGKNLTAGTMGSDGITAGCVITGLTALTSAGISGCNPLTDSPWVEAKPIATMYDYLTNGEENVSDYYKAQYYMEFADLQRVFFDSEEMGWSACGVNGARMKALLAEAEEKGAEQELIAAAQSLSETELQMAVPNWGRTYYALYDHVKTLK